MHKFGAIKKGSMEWKKKKTGEKEKVSICTGCVSVSLYLADLVKHDPKRQKSHNTSKWQKQQRITSFAKKNVRFSFPLFMFTLGFEAMKMHLANRVDDDDDGSGHSSPMGIQVIYVKPCLKPIFY